MSPQALKRSIAFDMLRTIIIVVSIILHFDTKFYLGSLAFPAKYIQNHLFTIGAIFFFTSGVFGYRCYLPQFRENSFLTSKKLIYKGLTILGIYTVYIIVMRIATNVIIPSDFFELIFSHPFFLKVLFTFGVLFIISPLFLLIISFSDKYIFLFLVLIYISLIASFEMSYSNRLLNILFHRGITFYPIIPSLFVYCFGMLYGKISNRHQNELQPSIVSFGRLLFILIILVSLLVIDKTIFQNVTIYAHLIGPIREAVVIWIFIVITDYLLSNFLIIKRLIQRSQLLYFGIESLTAYVTANIFIGLISTIEGRLNKILVLISILFITYLAVSWKSQRNIAKTSNSLSS
jgi:hypothetical protein